MLDTLLRRTDSPLTEWVFLRALGLIYFCAFASLAVQIVALIGADGLIPADRWLSIAGRDAGIQRFFDLPTLFWLGVNDNLLYGACLLGALVGLMLIAGQLPRICTVACYLLYLSLVSIGQPFTSFQWDALLLEAGFLAIFAGSMGTWLLPWTYRLLLFRLMFGSGLVKLTSGDANWRNLHAMRVHFTTQPLPTPLAWYMQKLPGPVLDALTFTVLVIELACPFLLFIPGRTRRVGASILIGLQVAIMLTGNYAFFNLLTIALCLWGFEERDFLWAQRWYRTLRARRFDRLLGPVTAGFLVLLMLFGITSLADQALKTRLFASLPLAQTLASLEVVNSYGLFAVMTTDRPEIVIEGSPDGQSWKAYELPYKPGNLNRALPIVAPHQPRVDWQLWFAALSPAEREPWFNSLAIHLLRGDRSTRHLFSTLAFEKPRYVRAVVYDYRFSTTAERKSTGAIWKRIYHQSYLPAVSLQDVPERREDF